VTKNVKSYSYRHGGKRIIIVDTPGFDDSNLSDEDILMELLNWLQEQHGRKLFNAVLYLHRIDIPRMQGSALRYLSVFRRLCGEAFYKNVFLGTTCWDKLEDQTIGEQREKELKEPGGFWYTLVRKGSTVVRIPQEDRSARELVGSMASIRAKHLQSQVDMSQNGLEHVFNSTLTSFRPEMEIVQRMNKEELQEEQEAFATTLQMREIKFTERAEALRKKTQRHLDLQERKRKDLLDAHKQNNRSMEAEMESILRRTKDIALKDRLRGKEEGDRLLADLINRTFFADLQRLQKAIALGIIEDGKDVDAKTYIISCNSCKYQMETQSPYGKCAPISTD
jgi:hypothetical protein